MLAKDGNGTTDFKNGNEDGWPARRNKELSQALMGKERHPHTKQILTMQWEK
jgi:hypothetical protein